VSVVIPTFNAESFVGEALQSVHDQTLKAVEVIIVDDGSTDGTLRVVEGFRDSLDLTIVRQPNAGPSAARNTGIRRARGRYCAFLDADDVMLPQLLSIGSAVLDAQADVGFVLTNVLTFDGRGPIQFKRWNLSTAPGETVLDKLLVENFVTTSAVMVRTERLIEAGLFNERRRVAEDYELWLSLASRWKVGLIDESLVRYRYTQGSLSSDKLFSARSALEVVETFWREHPDYARDRASVRRQSLGRHLANAGHAAAAQGRRLIALGYFARSLRYCPHTLGTWKGLVKISILGSEQLAARARPRLRIAV
jgi:glycosyltransferase involved in cell wall biosynthesis